MIRRTGRIKATAFLGIVLPFVVAQGVSAQSADFARYEATLKREAPETHELMVRLDRIQGLLFGALAEEGETVRASDDKLPSPNFEFDMLDELGILAREDGTLENKAREAEAGYAALGSRAAGIIEWTTAFRRAALGVIADPSITDRSARQSALAALVQTYKSRPEMALPTVPKDMDILYEHTNALQFRTGYADLDGLIWAGYWLKLAASKPLLQFQGAERTEALDTVQERYYSKLSYGEPPAFFPSELPLFPAMASVFSFLAPQVSSVADNLSMLEEVLADILASPNETDVPAAIDRAITFFMDPRLAVTDHVEFASMALRHGIFYQGGFPLAVMTQSERNATHDHGDGGNFILPGMP